MGKTVWLAGGLAVVAAAGVAGWLLLGGSSEANAPSQETIAQGQELYQANCASCHGKNRQGQANWRQRKPDGKLPAPPLDGSGHSWHHPDQQLIAMITQGVEAMAPAGYKSDMKGFGDELSDAEIRAILAYVKSEWPEQARERQAQISARSGG